MRGNTSDNHQQFRCWRSSLAAVFSRARAQADGTAGAGARADAGTAEPSVTVLGSRQAEGILGKEVRSSADENMGRIVDVIVDRTGRVRAAVIDFGGFLGVGNRKIAVDWNALNFAPDGDKRDVITLELTRDQVKAAPEYKDKQAVIVLGAAGRPASAMPIGNRVPEKRLPGEPARRRIEPSESAAPAPPEPARICVAPTPDGPRDRTAASLAQRACAASTGSCSSSPTCRPGSARSSRSI